MWTLEDYILSDKIQRCANDGARKATEAAKNAGLPIAYSLNGTIIFQLADGSVTQDRELIDKLYAELEKNAQNKEEIHGN